MKDKIIYFHIEYGNKWFYLCIIMIVGFLLRVPDLERLPPPLWQDEALFGYNAYCISETLRAANGDLLPVFFRVWNNSEYSGGLIYYIFALFINFLGPTIFVIRTAAATIGLLTIFFTYKLCELYFEKSVALIAALLLAISPWHIQFSRIAMDQICLPLFLVTSLYFISSGLFNDRPKHLIISSILISLSFYSYPPARLFVSLFYVFFLFMNYKKLLKQKKLLVICGLIIFFILLPFIRDFKEIQGSRFNLLSISNSYYSLEPKRIEFQKANLGFIADNNFLLLPTIFMQNYFKHMSTDFLLVKGSRNIREHVPGGGQLSKITFWTSLIGLLYLILSCKKELYIFPFWYLIFPIPASLTWEGIPHAGRTIGGVPVFEILAAVGLLSLISAVRKCLTTEMKNIGLTISIFILVLTLTGLFDLAKYLREYFVSYPRYSVGWFNYDFYQISKTTKNMKEYTAFIMPYKFDQTLFLYTRLFIQKVDPKDWLSGNLVLEYLEPGREIVTYSKGKMARIVRPGAYIDERTVEVIRNEYTDEIMFEIKEVNYPKVQDTSLIPRS